MKAVPKMFIYAKRSYKIIIFAIFAAIISLGFIYAKEKYTNADFGKSFGVKANAAEIKLNSMQEDFITCTALCNTDVRFMQSIVFPEVMRYNNIKDGVEAESLRTLYVQFGEAYANFSIGLFQMKPTFAEQVEIKSTQLLSQQINQELQLSYTSTDDAVIRQQRVERLLDKDWQLVYLTAFIAICNEIYKHKSFSSKAEKLQWYATIYNAGFDKTDDYIHQKIKQDNFYLSQHMPGKKFKYAAIAGWFYNRTTKP